MVPPLPRGLALNALGIHCPGTHSLRAIEMDAPRRAIEERIVPEYSRSTDSDTPQGRVWASVAAPFLLVEAKNWSKRVDQQVVSVFRVKMQGRRGSVRIGLLCGASGLHEQRA